MSNDNIKPSTITTQAYNYVQKHVTPSGSGGAVYLPKGWVGCKVQVLLLEPCNQDEKRGEG